MHDLISLLSDCDLSSAAWLAKVMLDLDSPAALMPMLADDGPEYCAAAIIAVNTFGE